jgi:hypothetical protein
MIYGVITSTKHGEFTVYLVITMPPNDQQYLRQLTDAYGIWKQPPVSGKDK